MTEEEMIKLKAANVKEYLIMDRDASNVIKQLLYELEINEKIFIELYDPTPGGYITHYRTLEGDPREVLLWAETLGFTYSDTSKLEV